jgi:hypothetical protein
LVHVAEVNVAILCTPELVEGLREFCLPHDVVVTVAALAGEFACVRERMARSVIGMAIIIVMPARNAAQESAAPHIEKPCLVERKQRIILVVRKLPDADPGDDPEVCVRTSIPVSEIVVVVVRPHEQMDQQWPDGHNVPRHKSRVPVIGKKDGREQHAATCDVIVPVAVDKNGPARRPHIAGRRPHPVFVGRRPVPGAPHVVVVLVLPVAGHPEVVVVRCGSVGPHLFARRRLRQIADLLGFGGRPEAWCPLESAAHLQPGARNPALSGGNIAPQAADPDKVRTVVVPRPIAGDPFDI